MNSQNISILSPETWPFNWEWLPDNAYLVGGAVRNALLQQQGMIKKSGLGYLDLDFVLPGQAVSLASKIAKAYKAGFVVLDQKRKIARVVFENATVDFAKQEGCSLTADLGRRDYTMNAIAYHPRTGELVDPFNGRADIQQRTIRMISPTNLADDPLRLLRAYRQGAQLGFAIDSETQKAIRQLAPFLNQVAPERIRTELNYILDCPQGANRLTAAWQDGLLSRAFPDATAESLAQVENADLAAAILAETWPELGEQLYGSLPETLKVSSYLSVAKLAGLVSSEPKPAETQLIRLKFSRAEINAVTRVLHGWQQYQSLENKTNRVRSQYFLFQEVKEMFPALAVKVLGANLSPKTSLETSLENPLENLLENLRPLVEKYLDPADRTAHPIPLVTGQELMAALEIPRGPKIGELLTEIAIARARGQISTPEEAIAFAQQRLD